jgi:hypothetical protein
MTRTVNRKYTFWLAGYYDDFMGATALPDDSNSPNLKWYTSSTHHGNPINGKAPLNPRYKYAWVERGNGDSGRFNNASVSSAIQQTFNNGISDWASLDIIRDNVGKWDGLAQLFYPDSLTNANRQRYDEGTGLLGERYKYLSGQTGDDDYAPIEGYALFCNGYNTLGKYYAGTGLNDSTYGRAQSYSPEYNTGGIAPALETEAGMPMQNASTILSEPSFVYRTHLAGVYTGEVIIDDALNNGAPHAALTPVESVCGKPFLVSEIYRDFTSHSPFLVYDGPLNSKSDGDIFTIRVAAFSNESIARVKICIGGEGGSAWSSTSTTDSTFTNFAVEYEIEPVAFLETNGWADVDMSGIWDDYDFIFDYTAGTYDIVRNGVSVSTGNAIGTKSDGDQFTAADMYGWALQCNRAYQKVAVLVDRVGLIYPLNDYPLSTTDMPPATDFAYSAAVNSVSSLNVTVIDDDTQLKLMPLFSQSAYADWSLLMFRDNVDRPIWRGSITDMSYNNTGTSRTPTIKIGARDFFSDMDNQMPMWELGQNGEGDSTTQVSYDRSESQNELNMYNFGTSILTVANKTLGFNEVIDGSGNFNEHLDTRMRNRSAHPIQMYLGEDSNGPNDAHGDWDDAITAGYATVDAEYRSVHSRWLEDLPKSLWFRHLFSKIDKNAERTASLAADFSVGDTTMTLDTHYSEFSGDGGSIEFVDGDGYVDSGVYESVSSTGEVSGCIIRVYEQRFSPTNYPGRSLQNVLNTFGTSPGFLFTVHLLIPKSEGAVTLFNRKKITITGQNNIYDDTWETDLYLVPMNYAVGPYEITVNGIDYHIFRLSRVSDGKALWFSEPIAGYRIDDQTPRFGALGNADITQSDIASQYFTYGTNFRLNSEFTNVDIEYGQTVLNIPETNFFKRDHSNGDSLTVRKLDTDDYKHIWVLWADMRNNGNADADSSYRKSNFGLLSPYSGNYELTLGVADDDISVVEERGTFTDLKIGEEIDLWEMDAEVDPISGNAWSAVTGGSNSETDTKYHNWEDKAGAFVIIDTSKFFNLNTASNGGKTGQASGGRREIGDYLVETEGFPILIDNYWVEAPATYKNLDDVNGWNSNYKYFLNDTTVLKESIRLDDRVIQFADASILPSITRQVGSIVSESKNTIFHYGVFNGSADLVTDFTTGRSVTINTAAGSAGDGKVTITDNTSNLGLKIGELYREGHVITISGSTSTPSIDGDYTIVKTNPVSASTPYATTTTLSIELDDPTVNIYQATPATATLTAPNTRAIRNVVHLGNPVVGTTATGQWNGAGYGTGNNNAYYLTDTGVSPNNSQNKSKAAIDINPDSQNNYSDAIVYSGLANVFPMRLMMQLNGFVENKASGTWFDSEKFRCAYSDILAETWLKQAKAYGIPNISSIPITRTMNTEQKNAIDYSGKITNITTPSGGTSTFTTGAAHNLSVGDVVTVMDSQRINLLGTRKDFTITAKTSTTFTAANSVTPGASGSYGRWRKASSVDDFGGVNDCRNTTLSTIFSSTQSLANVSDKYSQRQVFSWLIGRDGRPSYRPNYNTNMSFDENNLKVSSVKTQSVKQFTNVRVFYGGSGLFVDYPEPSLNSTPRWKVLTVPEVSTNAEALSIARAEYEKSSQAPLSINAQVIRLDENDANNMFGNKTVMLKGARYGYVADQSRTIPRTFGVSSQSYTSDRAWAWASMWGGNLFPGMVSALDGRDGNANTTSGLIDYDENYFWYGANSVSYAVQVVHIPRNMPKVSQKTPSGGYINADGKLRIVIEVGDEDTIEFSASAANPVFTIKLIDYEWQDQTYIPNHRDSRSVVVDSNGYYPIEIPSEYWDNAPSGDNIILSVNYDYLLAVAKNRCGSNNLRNANEYEGSTTFGGTTQPESLFPLGARKYADADYWNIRAEWYAPRLHICDDINFVPGTQVFYSDAAMSLSNEAMAIKSVSWSQKSRSSEVLSFNLERDVSRNVQDFAALLLPSTNKGGTNTTPGNGAGDNLHPSQQGGQGFNLGGYGGNSANGAFNALAGMNIPTNSSLGDRLNPSRTGMLKGGADGFTVNADSNFALGSSFITNSLTKRVKGVMDFNNDSVTGGSFGVLGQKKPSSAPKNTDPESGTDSFTTTSSGDVSTSTRGMSFAGATDAVNAYNESSTTLRVPSNPRGNIVNVSSRYTLNATSQSAVLFVTVECIETGSSKTTEVTLASATNAYVPLFTGVITGADVPSNTIRVTIGRDAGNGDDTAQYSALTLHTIEVAFDTQSVSGTGQSQSLTYGR